MLLLPLLPPPPLLRPSAIRRCTFPISISFTCLPSFSPFRLLRAQALHSVRSEESCRDSSWHTPFYFTSFSQSTPRKGPLRSGKPSNGFPRGGATTARRSKNAQHDAPAGQQHSALRFSHHHCRGRYRRRRRCPSSRHRSQRSSPWRCPVAAAAAATPAAQPVPAAPASERHWSRSGPTTARPPVGTLNGWLLGEHQGPKSLWSFPLRVMVRIQGLLLWGVLPLRALELPRRSLSRACTRSRSPAEWWRRRCS